MYCFFSGYSDSESSSSRSLDDLSSAGELARSGGLRRHSTEDSLSSEDLLDDPPARDNKHSNSLTLGKLVCRHVLSMHLDFRLSTNFANKSHTQPAGWKVCCGKSGVRLLGRSNGT